MYNCVRNAVSDARTDENNSRRPNRNKATSLEGAWMEIEALKSASDQQNATIARLKKSGKSLQAELES